MSFAASCGSHPATARRTDRPVPTRSPLLQVALNGRTTTEHPAIPRSPDEVAREARASVDVGARVVHFHAYDPSGIETLAPGPCAATLRAVRSACPGVPLSLTTFAAIEPDPIRRLELIANWTELPDLVSANQGEEGIVDLCDLLIERGIGIEAGLLSPGDAEAFVRSEIATCCVRVLVEPMDADPERAVAEASVIEGIVLRAGISLEQVHHGDGLASWAVCARALSRGHGIRTGFEDTTVLPDGRRAVDNASLVRAAVEMMRGRREQ
jgi:uncharacterized protein (DUF849 family)